MKSMYATLIAVTVVAGLSVGCATKKYVQQTVSPVQQRVDGLDKKTDNQAAQIAEVEKGVSRVDEAAKGADTRAAAAGREAARANEQAALGVKDAANARSLAEKGIARTGEVETSLNTKIENRDNFAQVSTQSTHGLMTRWVPDGHDFTVSQGNLLPVWPPGDGVAASSVKFVLPRNSPIWATQHEPALRSGYR